MNSPELARLLSSIQPSQPDAERLARALPDVLADWHAPVEAMLASLDGYFDPEHAPDAFVPPLASWLDLDAVWLGDKPASGAGLERLRALVAAAPTLSRWRGTALGLRLFLQTATGVTGFVVDDAVTDANGERIPFHFRIVVPPEASGHADLIRRIVAHCKPVHVTAEIVMQRTPDNPNRAD